MNNKLYSILKKIACISAAAIISVTSTVTAFADSGTYTYSLADIDVAVTVTNDLVGFTQNVTSNNSYLDKIGADDVEEVRAAMQLNNIYLELIPKEGDVNFEILVSGKDAPSGASNFNELSQSELTEYFNQYISQSEELKSSSTVISETITSSNIENISGVNYFVTEVTSVSGNLVTVYVKKYYTIMQDKAVTFTLQTNGEAITDEMNTTITDIIKTADYKPIRKKLLDSPFVMEILTTFFSLLLFVGVLALILYLMIRAGKKPKKHVG
jgi:hypothetical protein